MKYRNLLTLLALVSATLSSVVAQPVKKFPAPVKAKVKGFAEAYCIAVEAPNAEAEITTILWIHEKQ